MFFSSTSTVLIDKPVDNVLYGTTRTAVDKNARKRKCAVYPAGWRDVSFYLAGWRSESIYLAGWRDGSFCLAG